MKKLTEAEATAKTALEAAEKKVKDAADAAKKKADNTTAGNNSGNASNGTGDAAKSGGMGWLWGVLVGLLALVGIFFGFKYCKKGDDEGKGDD